MRDYATASALPADPVPPAEHRKPNGRGAQRTRYARTSRGFALAQNFAEGPQLRLALANAAERICRRSGGTGSGGKPDKCGGKL